MSIEYYQVFGIDVLIEEYVLSIMIMYRISLILRDINRKVLNMN